MVSELFRYVTRISWLLVVSLPPAAVLGTERLSEPMERVSISHEFSNLAKWENGRLVTWEDGGAPARVLAFDRSGRLVTEAAISFPEAVRILLYGPTASAKGTLAVAGSAYTAQGAGASFIAWISPAGGVERVVRTSPFAVSQLCFSGDETLWAVGRVLNPDRRGDAPHDVFRHYDREGRLLGSLLPRESFATYIRNQHPTALSFLVASGDRIGFYAPASKEWVEVSLSGKVLGRCPGLESGPDLRGFMITGAALTSGGAAYVSADRREPGASRPTSPSQVYRLDRATASWIRVDLTNVFRATNKPFAAILGSDGDRLVITDSMPDVLCVRPE